MDARNYILVRAKLKCKKCGEIFTSGTLRGFCSDTCHPAKEEKLFELVCTKCRKVFQMAAPLRKRCQECREVNIVRATRIAGLLDELRPLKLNMVKIAEALDVSAEGIEQESVSTAIRTLPTIEEFILRQRFGLTKRTLADIGMTLGISRARTGTIGAKAIRMLKHPVRQHFWRIEWKEGK